jgi:hypothetical protein
MRTTNFTIRELIFCPNKFVYVFLTIMSTQRLFTSRALTVWLTSVMDVGCGLSEVQTGYYVGVMCKAVPWLRRLVDGLSPRKLGFDPGPVRVGFVVEKWHLDRFISQLFSIMFLSQYFSFPCQYHSTNAPYSFIHLPPTLYNVSLPVLQFPLSVSFHQRSILIHSSTTDAI